MKDIVKIIDIDGVVTYGIMWTKKKWFGPIEKRLLDLDMAGYNSFRWDLLDETSKITSAYTRKDLSDVASIYKKLGLPLYTFHSLTATELEKVIYEP